MSELHTAAQMLRDSVAALPDEAQERWRILVERMIVAADSGTRIAVATSWRGLQAAGRIVEHIAKTASPDRVLLLADLLEAIDRLGHPIIGDVIRPPDEVIAAAQAYSRAITGGGSG